MNNSELTVKELMRQPYDQVGEVDLKALAKAGKLLRVAFSRIEQLSD